MKIKCTNIILDGKKIEDLGISNGRLTVGKEYIVLVVYTDKTNYIRFQIECDDGELRIPVGRQFEMLSSYIPSNWEITFKTYTDSSCYLDLAPGVWNKALFNIGTTKEQGFYESIVEVDTPLEGWRKYPSDQIPEVVKLYFQEKDIIYKEEEAYEKASASGFNKPSSLLLNLIKGGK